MISGIALMDPLSCLRRSGTEVSFFSEFVKKYKVTCERSDYFLEINEMRTVIVYRKRRARVEGVSVSSGIGGYGPSFLRRET